MAVTFASVVRETDTNANNTINFSNILPVETFIMFVMGNASPAIMTVVPAGWTQIQSGDTTFGTAYSGMWIFHTGRDSDSPNGIWTHTTGWTAIYVTVRITGAHFGAHDADSRFQTNGTPVKASGVTVAKNNSMSIFFGGIQNIDGTMTPPAGYTERMDHNESNMGVYVATKDVSAGATGDVTATASLTGQNVGYQVILNERTKVSQGIVLV